MPFPKIQDSSPFLPIPILNTLTSSICLLSTKPNLFMFFIPVNAVHQKKLQTFRTFISCILILTVPHTPALSPCVTYLSPNFKTLPLCPTFATSTLNIPFNFLF